MPTLPPPAPDEADQLAADLGMTRTAAHVLFRRGHRDPASILRFLDPKLAHLTPPDTMCDRAAAAERLARAVRSHERICIFGDYDADGVTSAAIMADVLRILGGNVVTLLANRFEGGYGLSDPAVQRVLDTGATLVVTCDCGSSDHDRLATARGRGVDVIVLDHHRVPEEALPAFAFLNPHRPECPFPYKGLASCGLALSLCAALRADLGVPLDLRMWLDLVALGTIADVAPLDGDNRALVRAGMPFLARGQRPGIRALAEVAGWKADQPLTSEDVAFRFAPRINAPGRLQSPALALDLLLAATPEQAGLIAAQVDRICNERKVLDRAILAEAREILKDPALAALPVIVLGKQGWHPGVVGIVAGRLASSTGKPTIVIGFDGATGRGSVRGPKGFPLHDALSLARGALLSFGGHQAAAGVHVAYEHLDRLRDEFASAYTTLGSDRIGAPTEVEIDAVLNPADAPHQVVCELGRFEPCGHSNPAPRIALDCAHIRSHREVRGGHLKLEIGVGPHQFSGFGFEMGTLCSQLTSKAHIFGSLRHDYYRGNGAIEMRIDSIIPL